MSDSLSEMIGTRPVSPNKRVGAAREQQKSPPAGASSLPRWPVIHALRPGRLAARVARAELRVFRPAAAAPALVQVLARREARLHPAGILAAACLAYRLAAAEGAPEYHRACPALAPGRGGECLRLRDGVRAIGAARLLAVEPEAVYDTSGDAPVNEARHGYRGGNRRGCRRSRGAGDCPAAFWPFR